MDLKVGWLYRFSFTEYFNKLDGTYTLTRVYTFDELTNDGITIKESLYSVYNVPDTQYAADIPKIISEPIYKLVSVIDPDTTVYVPNCVLSTEPVFSVREYSNLVLAIPIGIYRNTEDLSSVKNAISEEIAATLGEVGDASYIAVSSKYLTENEYADAIKDRENKVKQVLNYFSENVKLQNTVSKQKTQIKALTDIIVSLQNNDTGA